MGEDSRYERINGILRRERGVPTYEGFLWEVDESICLRDTKEVARRILCLWVVSLYAEGVPLGEVWMDFIDKDSVWQWMTPDERKFLQTPTPDPDQSLNLVWRIESAWVLLWSLSKVPKLSWPVAYCDGKCFAELVVKAARDPAAFEREVAFRPKSEIIDAHSLTMRIHWALNDAYLNNRKIPENLNWLEPSQWIAPAPTLIGRLVQERHRALNWLVCLFDQEWDAVEIHT